MTGPIQERDWKYLRSLHDALLHELCSRILTEAVRIATADGDPHQRYLKLFRHLKQSDRIIARCFDDWRRSTILEKILCLRYHKLLPDEAVTHLSQETRERLGALEGILRKSAVPQQGQ